MKNKNLHRFMCFVMVANLDNQENSCSHTSLFTSRFFNEKRIYNKNWKVQFWRGVSTTFDTPFSFTSTQEKEYYVTHYRYFSQSEMFIRVRSWHSPIDWIDCCNIYGNAFAGIHLLHYGTYYILTVCHANEWHIGGVQKESVGNQMLYFYKQCLCVT